MKSVGSFLIDCLIELGVSRIYGVPGDYNLEFLELIESSNHIKFIGTCNELNASYAADGEARIQGISVVLTTYGVGDLAALPGLAGAYAEGVPVLSISGAPPLHAIRSKALLHHTLADGNYENVMNCFREFTVAQALITPENAVNEIQRVIQACWREKRPAYLQLPSDVCSIEIDTPIQALKIEINSSERSQLDAAANLITTRLIRAKRPVLILDSMVRSQQLKDQVGKLVDTLNIDFTTLGSAKAILPESSPHYLGLYNGKASSQALFDRISKADLILSLGVRFVDSTSAWFSQSLNPASIIDIQPFSVTADNEYFANVNVSELLDAIVKNMSPVVSSIQISSADSGSSQKDRVECDQKWCQKTFWQYINHFIASGDIVIAENGTSLTGLLQLKFPAGCDFVCQSIWGAIGYTLPALLGASLAAQERRQLLFIGDGSFQLTVQELSTILRHNLNPVIFLINNKGYTIERLILGESSSYNDIADWSYTKLPSVFVPSMPVHSVVVSNIQELEDALNIATVPEKLIFIEVRFDIMDSPYGMSAFGKMARDYDYNPVVK